jgi:festuclavine dehydrogenase
VHVKLSEEEKVQRFMSAGMPEHYAKFLAGIEAGSAKGMEERENNAVERVTGKPAQRFDDWVQQNKTAWG